MKPHERLAIAHGFGGGTVPRAKLAQRKVPRFLHIVAVLLQRAPTVLLALAPLFLDQMIGHIGGQTLAPVAGRVVHEHRIAPPVVENLVRIGRGENEREPNDRRSQQGEGRHAVTGFPEILHQRELLVRVGTDQVAVHLDVLSRGRQVLGCQGVICRAQKDLRADRASGLLVGLERSPHDIDLVHGAA